MTSWSEGKKFKTTVGTLTISQLPEGTWRARMTRINEKGLHEHVFALSDDRKKIIGRLRLRISEYLNPKIREVNQRIL